MVKAVILSGICSKKVSSSFVSHCFGIKYAKLGVQKPLQNGAVDLSS
jgi:hypothetical protein